MITPQQRRHRVIRRALEAQGVPRARANQIVLEGYKGGNTISQWRQLLSISRRNPTCLKLAPRLISFRLRVDPTTLESPDDQARLKKQVNTDRLERPQGQKCPACLQPTLMVEFGRRSTGPGGKFEEVRIAKCLCGHSD